MVKNEVQLRIFNIMGKEIYRETLYSETTVNVDNLSAGIYFAEFITNGYKENVVKKLIVK